VVLNTNKDNLYLVPPAVRDIATEMAETTQVSVRESYRQRLVATRDYIIDVINYLDRKIDKQNRK
jgi:hypothetical protein